MVYLILALAVPALFYIVLIGGAAVGFSRTRSAGSRADDGKAWDGRPLPTVSVIIPARNEASSIRACIEAILGNAYPEALLEIVVVDDGSQDRTAEVVRSYARQRAITTVEGGDEELPIVRLVCIPNDPDRRTAHKKEALERGVAKARGEIVLTTDADCVPARTWIRSMVDAFDDDAGMVTGPVLYRRSGTAFGDLQALEFLGLVALGAGLVELGRPHLCNSANLAYRRAAYVEAGGYEGLEDVSTGDDEMLMHRIAYETDWEVTTCMRPEAAVTTDSNASLAAFFRQRKRWASAHARYPHLRLRAISLLCYLFYLELAIAAIAAFLRPELGGIVATFFVLKVAVEGAVLVPAARRFDRSDLLLWLGAAELVHLVYILVIGAAGTFGGYEWKGRRVPR
jgi:cellulose synthase/poly-beta-1,6-N-acetylglucosamine synthase-like glycosyltransferase